MRWTDLSSERRQPEITRSSERRSQFIWREAPPPPAEVKRIHPDRQAVIDWAQRVCNDPNALFLDTETTGLGKTAEIVDIAVVRGDGTVLLDTLVRPLGPIPSRSSEIHGIYDHHVRDAPTWEEVVAEVCALLSDRRVIVYNAKYDSRIIADCCERVQTVLPVITYECAMLQYATYAGAVGNRTGKYRWHKLEHAALHLGVTPGGHRALGDAEACRGVVLGMAEGRLPLI